MREAHGPPVEGLSLLRNAGAWRSSGECPARGGQARIGPSGFLSVATRANLWAALMCGPLPFQANRDLQSAERPLRSSSPHPRLLPLLRSRLAWVGFMLVERSRILGDGGRGGLPVIPQTPNEGWTPLARRRSSAADLLVELHGRSSSAMPHGSLVVVPDPPPLLLASLRGPQPLRFTTGTIGPAGVRLQMKTACCASG